MHRLRERSKQWLAPVWFRAIWNKITFQVISSCDLHLFFFAHSVSLVCRNDMAIEWWWISETVLQWFLWGPLDAVDLQPLLKPELVAGLSEVLDMWPQNAGTRRGLVGPAATSTGTDVRSMLDEVANVFQGPVDGSVSPRANLRVEEKSLNWHDVTDEIKSLEAALAATPKSAAVVRATLEQELVEKRKNRNKFSTPFPFVSTPTGRESTDVSNDRSWPGLLWDSQEASDLKEAQHDLPALEASRHGVDTARRLKRRWRWLIFSIFTARHDRFIVNALSKICKARLVSSKKVWLEAQKT